MARRTYTTCLRKSHLLMSWSVRFAAVWALLSMMIALPEHLTVPRQHLCWQSFEPTLSLFCVKSWVSSERGVGRADLAVHGRPMSPSRRLALTSPTSWKRGQAAYARWLGRDTDEISRRQIRSLNEGVDEADRVVLANVFVQRFRQQQDLGSVGTGDVRHDPDSDAPCVDSESVPEEISHGLHEKRGSDFGPKSRGFERYQNARVAASSEAARPPARGKKNPAGARVINIFPLSDIAGRDCVGIGGSRYASTSTFSTWKGGGTGRGDSDEQRDGEDETAHS
jgi:hypothetical protein